jgi:hypothetical protein
LFDFPFLKQKKAPGCRNARAATRMARIVRFGNPASVETFSLAP